MRMLKRLGRHLFALAIVVLLINIAPQITRAQPRCQRSPTLSYILRNEQGKVIDANQDGLWVSPGWRVTDRKLNDDLPAAARKLIGKLNVFVKASEGCFFTEPVKLQLILHGKNMNLIFHPENKGSLIVDSLPFQQGTFEDDLPAATKADETLYSSKGWKKVSDKAEAVFVRGRVLDALTGEPVAGARVSLVSKPDYGAEANTDAKGFFDLKYLRAASLEKFFGVAVLAEHPHYLKNYTIVLENKEGSPFQSATEVIVRLAPAVTVSGRVIDLWTGSTPPGAEKFYVTFKYGSGKFLWTRWVTNEVGTKVKADGTFTIKTAPGKNSLILSDSGLSYQFADLMDSIDVGKEGSSNTVLKLVKRHE